MYVSIKLFDFIFLRGCSVNVLNSADGGLYIDDGLGLFWIIRVAEAVLPKEQRIGIAILQHFSLAWKVLHAWFFL